MTLTKLPAALAKFQSQHHAAGRDGKGNYGTYTTLAGALAAVQPACALGLSHTQLLVVEDSSTRVRTVLMHESGEQLESDVPVIYEGGRGNPMQALGSAITYARRYGVLSIYGIAGDDDDGEGAAPTAPAPASTAKKSNTPTQTRPPAARTETQPSTPKGVEFLSDKDVADLKRQVQALPPDARSALVDSFKKQFEIPAGVKTIADRIQFPVHAAFIADFISSLPES